MNKQLLKTAGPDVLSSRKNNKKKTSEVEGGGGGGVGNHPSLYVLGLRHQKTPSRKQSQHAFFTLSSSLNLQLPNVTTKYTIIFPMLPGSKLDDSQKQNSQ